MSSVEKPGFIYLDNNASTPCDPRVLEAMLPYFSENYANPSSPHLPASQVQAAIEEARSSLAELIEASYHEIVFTSGATEANNLAIVGLALGASNSDRKKIVISAIEHKSVTEPCKLLERHFGFTVEFLPVDADGLVILDEARTKIDDQTLLVSIQLANNEVGTIQPMQDLSELAHDRGAIIHCDAAQAVGKISVSVDELGVDLLSLSGHKFYGPKGIGALFIRAELKSSIERLMRGGGQEFGIRSGTQNVPAIVGIGEAARISAAGLEEENIRLKTLRDEFEDQLFNSLPGVRRNGHPTFRLPNTTSLTIQDVDAEALIANVKGIALSSSAACTTGALEPSHVLLAMGRKPEHAYQTIRVAVGRFTTRNDIHEAVRQISQAAGWIRTTASPVS